MKKVKILLFIALACILVLPFSVFAEGEEEETTTKEENREVTLYFFRGEGCSHCAEFEAWLDEIEPEYGDLFKVVDYEVWNDEEKAYESICSSYSIPTSSHALLLFLTYTLDALSSPTIITASFGLISAFFNSITSSFNFSLMFFANSFPSIICAIYFSYLYIFHYCILMKYFFQ